MLKTKQKSFHHFFFLFPSLLHFLTFSFILLFFLLHFSSLFFNFSLFLSFLFFFLFHSHSMVQLLFVNIGLLPTSFLQYLLLNYYDSSVVFTKNSDFIFFQNINKKMFLLFLVFCSDANNLKFVANSDDLNL